MYFGIGMAGSDLQKPSSASRSTLESHPGRPEAPADEGHGLTVASRFRAARGLAQGDLWGAEAPKGTNTKVLVEVGRRICRDIVVSTGRLEETLSAELLMCCPDKTALRKIRARRLPEAPLISRKGLLALYMNFARAKT